MKCAINVWHEPQLQALYVIGNQTLHHSELPKTGYNSYSGCCGVENGQLKLGQASNASLANVYSSISSFHNTVTTKEYILGYSG